MRTPDVLRAAKELISDQSRWTTEEAAKDSSGHPVREDSPNAVCWCSYGAVGKVSANNPDAMWDACEYLEMASESLFNVSVIRANDKLGHSSVMRIFEKAAHLAEAEK